MKNYLNKRRQFIKNIGLTALGASSLPSSILSLKTWAAAAANNSSTTGDYKALVCLQFFGGNDGWNMLVPKGTNEYQEYSESRGNLALAQEDLLSINPIKMDKNNEGQEFGVHPKMPEVQHLFEEDKLSFLCNIGTKLIQKTTMSDFQNQINLPLSLMSHNEQGAQWQTARVSERSGIGWAGKIADLMSDMKINGSEQNIPMNISLFTSPHFMRGEKTTNFNLSERGPRNFQYRGGTPGNFYGQRAETFNQMFEHDYGNPFYNNYNRIYRNGIAATEEFITTLDASTALSTPFLGGFVSQNLKMVARSIAIGEELGLNRQIFFVHVPAFDNHKDLLVDHGNNMKIVSSALMEFQTAMEELGKENDVVTFSISDFGRTLTANGANGSDHAWGSNALVMGGPVIGRSLYGEYPSLALNNSDVMGDRTRGIIIPTTSTDVYFAELAHWYGVPKSDLGMIFPNLHTFMPTDDLPLGFLNI